MAERYVRPPLVAREAPSAWVSVWRFRLLLALAVLILAAIVVLIVEALHPNSESNPGVNGLRPPAVGLSLPSTP